MSAVRKIMAKIQNSSEPYRDFSPLDCVSAGLKKTTVFGVFLSVGGGRVHRHKNALTSSKRSPNPPVPATEAVQLESADQW